MKFRKNKKGFTIVELIIVIAVIGVLTAVMVPTIVHLVGKANKASDEALVSNLNKASQLREVELGKPVTMHDAVLGLEDYGYKLDALVAKSDQALLYDLAENRFLLANDAKETKAADYWRIQDNASDQTYNIYASSKFAFEENEKISVGFDAGFKAISSVSYQDLSNPGKEVLIRTNGGELTINAEHGKVHHFGKANVVDVQKVDSSSYYEEGEAVFLKLSQGRAVVKEGASVGGIHVEANNVIVAVEEDVELPVVTFDESVTSFYVQETNEKGEKQAQSTVSISGDEVTTAASEGETAVPAAVATKVEASEEATAEEAKEKTAEVITPEFDSKYAASIGWNAYLTLEDAFNAVGQNETIKVLKDSSGNGIAVASGHNFTVDFQGHCYDIDATTVGSPNTQTNAFQLLKDSTLVFKNGTIKSSKAKMLMQNYANTTYDNMVLDGRELNIAATGAYTSSNNNGVVTIKDTVIYAKEGGMAFDVCRYSTYKSVSVTIEGKSVINGKIELYVGKGDVKDGASLYLNGGDFSKTEIADAGHGDLVEVHKAAGVSITLPEWVNVVE